jgi:hypothetical protein
MKTMSTMARFSIVCGLLGLGAVAVFLSPYLLGAELDKDPAPLSHDLILLNKELGSNPKFVAQGSDDIMQPDILDALGTKLYLLRNYAKVGANNKPSDDLVALNINYYEKGTATPHVPDICWVGSGLTNWKDEQIVVHNVPHKDGTITDIPMHFLSFVPKESSRATVPGLEDNGDQDHLLSVAYTFQVNGQYVGNKAQVARLFWRRDSRYCYHCKIEITYKRVCSREKAQPVIEDFLRASLPKIEECLPDWNKLNSSSEATAVVPAKSPGK